MTLNERELKLPACVIGTVVDGSITRIEEWINTMPMMKHLSPEQIKLLTG